MMSVYDPTSPPFFEERLGGGPMMTWEAKHRRARAADRIHELEEMLADLYGRLDEERQETEQDLEEVSRIKEMLVEVRDDVLLLAERYGLKAADAARMRVSTTARDVRAIIEGRADAEEYDGHPGYSYAHGGDGNGNRRCGKGAA